MFSNKTVESSAPAWPRQNVEANKRIEFQIINQYCLSLRKLSNVFTDSSSERNIYNQITVFSIYLRIQSKNCKNKSRLLRETL